MATRCDVQLRTGESDGDLVRFRPGEEIVGTAEVVADDDVRCDHLYVRLRWRSEGSGDRDEVTVEEVDLFQGVLPAGAPFSQEFRFRAPREPWSYTGKYFTIEWAIQVSVAVPRARDEVYNHPFVLAPRR